jgi:hypothetical protein
MSLRKQL